MKHKIIKSTFAILLVLSLFLPCLFSNTYASSRYSYIADGANDLLGFRLSDIQQIENCDTIEISMTAPKDFVQFSSSQALTYNGKEYASGVHSLSSIKNISFIYKVSPAETISNIVLYMSHIEDTSCALEIRFCQKNAIIEKINMTLTASFLGGVADELRSHKETSTGSLIQEDVVISHPNKPITSSTTTTTTTTRVPTTTSVQTTSPSTTVPTTTMPTQPTAPTSKPECNHEVTETIGYKDASSYEDGYTGDTICKSCNTILRKGMVINMLSMETNHIALSIIDKEASILPSATQNDKNALIFKLFDFIHSLDKMDILIAIAIVFGLLCVCLILIAILSNKKPKAPKKKHEKVKVVKKETLVPAMPAENAIIEEETQSTDETEVNVSEESTPPEDEIDTNVEVDIIIDEEANNKKAISEDEMTPLVEGVAEEAPQKEALPEIPLYDEYNAIMMATLPAAEIEKILYDFNDIENDDDVDEYKDIVSE